MTEEETRFLDAIRAEPDEDGPRLVYADWLTQRGDLRGEHIVISCELERELPLERRAALVERAAAIAPKQPFLGFRYELPVGTHVLGELDVYARGFVPALGVFALVEELAARKDELYRLAPCAQELSMYASGSTPPWAEVLADPDVTRWGALRGLPTETLEIAAQHAHLDALREITIQPNDRDGEELMLDPIFERGRFAHLDTLNIEGMIIDSQSPGLPAIEDARWRSAAFAPTLRAFDGEMLANLDVFPKLESFSSFYYGSEWLQQIVQFSGALKTFDIGGFDDDPLDMATLAAVLSAPCLRTLETLSLTLDRGTSHTSTGWRALERMRIAKLSLQGHWVDGDLARALPPLPTLKELRIARRYERLSAPALAALFTHPWAGLETLDLGTPSYGASEILQIVERLPALRRLRCGVDATATLLESRAIEKLDVLEVHTANQPVLPEARLPKLSALQLQFPYCNGFARETAGRWAASRGMRLLENSTVIRSRGDNALTFVKPSVWRASSS